MWVLTRLLLVTLLSGPCIPQSQEEFILLTLKSITSNQDTLFQKFDVLEEKLLAQHEQIENLKLSVGGCSTKHQISTFHDFLVTDECERNTHNCSVNATCRDSPIHFECFCMAGYSGDGVICEDVDECEADTNVCGDKEVCINHPGNYTCICQDGYEKKGDVCKAFICTPPTLELKPFGCVAYVEERLTWNGAQAKCIEDGGSLLYDFTKQQLSTISQHVHQYFENPTSYGWTAWVGILDKVFVNEDGASSSSPDADFWSSGYPSRSRSSRSNCGGVYLDISDLDLWDYGCHIPRPFLCQIPVPNETD